ncbi:MAG TPA: hypothetical protein VFV99_28790, partial [Kofleriaceae bacterium]|nr:hypothetical protein [Kofleriaceae bacterium]
MGGNDEGGQPPPKRTQFGIAVQTPPGGSPTVRPSAPVMPRPSAPVAMPQPPATSPKTQFGTGPQGPAPARVTPQPIRVPMATTSQAKPVAAAPSQARPVARPVATPVGATSATGYVSDNGVSQQQPS